MQSEKENILIEDTFANLQILSQSLSKRGYNVRSVAKPQMAIRIAEVSPPDLILLDIIFIRAIDEVFDQIKAFEVGGVDYITKPFHLPEVLARVEHQLTIRRRQKLQDKQEQIPRQKLQQEIKPRKKAESAADSQAKSQFLANMSQKLRTPLNAILGFTQLRAHDPLLTPKQQEHLGIIHRSENHLLELINDVLNLTIIESGTLVLREELDSEAPPMDFGHTSPKEIYLWLEVSDTGCGIDSQEIDTVFQSFVQTSSGLKLAEGTGLGLSITKKNVNLMGGKISLESRVGTGTNFRFNQQLKPTEPSPITIIKVAKNGKEGI
ncbi:MAG: hybrid sensor histidine kinase/response regulator, partial [Nostocales cyanobacterium W4_Combined_metabat2_030]|nr:hybrid sensor histidine kinase/response regulator [Nostocales cyanobacterium W4_Combined_metabat2_030]